MVAVHWPRWPPCPYMVKPFKNLLLQNWGCLGAESVHKSSGTGDLPKLLKRLSYVDIWPFYGKVKFASLCICMSPITFVWENCLEFQSYCGQSVSVVHHAAWTIALKAYSSCAPGPIDSILGRKHQGDCRSKIAKVVRLEIQDGRHLENLFFASSPEPKGQLTPNLLGSIRVTCRSNIAKVVSVGNPRWPPWQPSWKSIFRFYS